eukprot:g5257.t1
MDLSTTVDVLHPYTHMVSKVVVPKEMDVHEFLFSAGLTDGLPCVPCTEGKLLLALSNLPESIQPDDVIGLMPPALCPCTVTDVVINAIMAGCDPDCPHQHRIVIAAVRALLDDTFNLHGVSATTMGATPALIINGDSIIKKAGLNTEHGCIGSGQLNRSNLAVGRAIKLVLQNVGRSSLGGTESTTIGGPRKIALTIVENHEALGCRNPPWKPFAGDGNDVVTVHSVSSGIDQLVDSSADAQTIINFLGQKLSMLWSPMVPMMSEAIVIISREHYYTLHDAGIHSKVELQKLLFTSANIAFSSNYGHTAYSATKGKEKWKRMIAILFAHLQKHVVGLVCMVHPPAGHSVASKFYFCGTCALVFLFSLYFIGIQWVVLLSFAIYALYHLDLIRPVAYRLAAMVPKLNSYNSLHIIVTGSIAGKYSAVMPGFGMNAKAPMKISKCVTKAIPSYTTPNKGNRAKAMKQMKQELQKPVKYIIDPRGTGKSKRRLSRQCERKKDIKTIGLCDISKPGGSVLFNRLEKFFVEKKGCIVKRYCKPTFARPIPKLLCDQIAAECDVVINGLAD